MTRRASAAQTRAFDDQVAATLRDLGQATTGQIREALGDTMLTRTSRGITCRCRCGEIHHYRHTEWTAKPDASDVRPSLRRIARGDRCIEIPTSQPNNHGGHLWLWTGDENG